MCTKYSEVTKEKCELTFIDKYGKCYYSGDLWPCVLTDQWDWHWLYFEGAGEVQCFVFHTKKFGRAYNSTDNKQVNQIYEWCEDVMGIDA